MSTSKQRVLSLAALEREIRNAPDADLRKAIAGLPEEGLSWIAGLAGTPDADDADAVDIAGLRGALQRGRMKGLPQKVAAVLTDACLQQCIELLGDRADLPSEADLREVVPALVQEHGVSITRVMFAATVEGEAPAAADISRVLKLDERLTLPA